MRNNKARIKAHNKRRELMSLGNDAIKNKVKAYYQMLGGSDSDTLQEIDWCINQCNVRIVFHGQP